MDQNTTTQQQTTTTTAATNEPIILNESPISPKKDRRMSDEWGKPSLTIQHFPTRPCQSPAAAPSSRLSEPSAVEATYTATPAQTLMAATLNPSPMLLCLINSMRCFPLQSHFSPMFPFGNNANNVCSIDASKVPPSRFQKRKGSIYATPSSRDGHVDRNYQEKYHAKIAQMGRKGSASS